ncbi:MAG: acyltransferase [Bdellovibrionota bacterium]
MIISNKPNDTRFAGLDLYRSAGLMIILTMHFLMRLGMSPSALQRTSLWTIDLFFVFSGYLVSRSIFQAFAKGQQPRVFRFYLARILRTWPAYFAVLPLFYFFFPATDVERFPPLWQLLTFSQNLNLEMNRLAFTWSLCVEEQFYFLLPLLCLVAWTRFQRRGLVVLAIVLVVGGGLLRAGLSEAVLSSPTRVPTYLRLIYFPIWSRLDSLVAGVAVSAIQFLWPSLWERCVARSRAILIFGICTFVLGCLVHVQMVSIHAIVFGFPLVALGLSCVIFEAVSGRSIFDGVKIPAAQYVAARSYSMYLVHPVALTMVMRTFKDYGLNEASLLCYLACVGASLAAGVVIYQIIERPMYELRHRFLA